MKKIKATLECALSATLLLTAFACSDSESADDTSGGSGGTGGTATSSSSSSSTGTESGGGPASSSSSASVGGGGGAGGGGGSVGDCDLDAQDCAARGESCYPTADGAICEPTGSGALFDQCTKNSDCGEDLFCNPDNFMSCVPWCHLGGDDCMMNTTCYDNPAIELPPGYGYCLPN